VAAELEIGIAAVERVEDTESGPKGPQGVGAIRNANTRSKVIVIGSDQAAAHQTITARDLNGRIKAERDAIVELARSAEDERRMLPRISGGCYKRIDHRIMLVVVGGKILISQANADGEGWEDAPAIVKVIRLGGGAELGIGEQ